MKSWCAFLAILLTGCLLGTVPAAVAQPAEHAEFWEAWTSESYGLAPGESFQMSIGFEDMPVRRWKLVVEGGDQRCDLSLLRVKGEELVYYQTDESRHEVSIPWGQDEELLLVLTNRKAPASFLVTLWGPPRDQVTAAYSYHVNRALEAYGSGQRLAAEQECRKALKADPADGVAKVLFAGFRRDAQDYEEATSLIEEALQDGLPPEMKSLAENLRRELVALKAPLPAAVRRGVTEADALIGKGQGEAALEICDGLLDGDLELDGPARSVLLTLRGRALEVEGRNFEAVDAYTHALSYDRSKSNQAQVYYHMGRLFYGMENLVQAQGAFTMALQNGLPGAQEIQARELLMDIQKKLAVSR